jgi:2-polyprenyl-6-methoxyphenol hydroxylase-like FAD-dependent oxidoreductase
MSAENFLNLDDWQVWLREGTAGYCASPLSGQGAGLALVGAYVLADELGSAGGDHRTAFARYEERMRPFVEPNQALATENPGGPAAEESLERAKNAISLDDWSHRLGILPRHLTRGLCEGFN